MNNLTKEHNSYLGFDSLSDFLNTVFGLKNKFINIYFALIGCLTSFIQNYVWNDANAIYFMLFLALMDIGTGIIKSVKKGNFKSARLPRGFISILVYCLLLGVSWQATHYSYYFGFLPGLMYGGIISTLILSLIENLGALGFLNNDLIQTIKSKLLFWKK